MSEQYFRYKLLENRVKEHSSDFVRWLNKTHLISIEEMIRFFEEGNWDVGFDRDRGLTFECINDIIKATKPYWKTAGF